MIGMVLVTHGRLAEELVAALEHVVGPQPNVLAVGIGPDDDMEERRLQIMESTAKVDDGNGVVVLTDMFGGTPSNLAISVMDQAQRFPHTRDLESLEDKQIDDRNAETDKAVKEQKGEKGILEGQQADRDGQWA